MLSLSVPVPRVRSVIEVASHIPQNRVFPNAPHRQRVFLTSRTCARLPQASHSQRVVVPLLHRQHTSPQAPRQPCEEQRALPTHRAAASQGTPRVAAFASANSPVRERSTAWHQHVHGALRNRWVRITWSSRASSRLPLRNWSDKPSHRFTSTKSLTSVLATRARHAGNDQHLRISMPCSPSLIGHGGKHNALQR